VAAAIAHRFRIDISLQITVANPAMNRVAAQPNWRASSLLLEGMPQ
jgi:hypothetical protein